MNWYKVFDSQEEAEKHVGVFKSVTVLIEQQKICLTRTDLGFFAIADECPHLGASLSRGTCNAQREVVCPWHSYRFNVQTGEETSGHKIQVRTYPVSWRNGGLYIGMPKS